MLVEYTKLAYALAVAFCTLTLARPAEDAGLYHQLSRRALSPDNTCGNVFNGNNKNYTCDPNSPTGGGCCSQYGYCGTTTDYCGSGCQPDFGTCAGSEVIPIDPNQCGPANKNNKCLSGLCCSAAGWCGNTTDYCSPTNGCQPGYGDCTTPPNGGGGGGGTCGPAFGNAQCPQGQCCSAAVCALFSPLVFCHGSLKEYCTQCCLE